MLKSDKRRMIHSFFFFLIQLDIKIKLLIKEIYYLTMI